METNKMRTENLRAGYTRGEYWYETASGLRQVTAPRPGERRRADVRSTIRERFRYALANETSMGQAEASAIIDEIDRFGVSY